MKFYLLNTLKETEEGEHYVLTLHIPEVGNFYFEHDDEMIHGESVTLDKENLYKLREEIENKLFNHVDE